MDVEERLLSVLENEGIDYERTTHEPVYTSKEAAEVRNVSLDTGVKAMVLEGSEGELLLGLVPADHRIDLERIGEEENERVSLADPEEVLKAVGCEVGSVPPFGHRNPLKTYLDPEILKKDEVNFNAGGHEVSVSIDAEDLPDCIEASGAELEILEIKE